LCKALIFGQALSLNPYQDLFRLVLGAVLVCGFLLLAPLVGGNANSGMHEVHMRRTTLGLIPEDGLESCAAKLRSLSLPRRHT